MAPEEIVLAYQDRLSQLQAGMEAARMQNAAAMAAIAVAAGVFLMLGLSAVRGRVSFWWPAAPVPVAVASARRFRRLHGAEQRGRKLGRFYDVAIARLRGEWTDGPSGEEFASAGHAYARDLNVVGEGSLFQLLCTVRSGVGRRGLARYLLETPSPEETLARQDAVRELSGRTDLRESIAALGQYESAESTWETFAAWLDAPPFRFPSWPRYVLPATAAAAACLLACGITRALPWATLAAWAAPALLLQAAACLALRRPVSKTIESVRALSVETRVIREGLQLLGEQQFQCAKLQSLLEQAKDGAAALQKLERLLHLLNERNKEWFFHVSLALAAGTQLSMAVERWRSAHGAALARWLDAWAEFEALNALARYAHEHPRNAFPEFTPDGASFEARAMDHPLLPPESCVANDVTLGATSRFYLVSGSNMSGKSTLLRAIGLNAALAYAGAPVPAGLLRLSRLSMCASLAPADSLREGRSRFFAEVDRLKQAIELSAGDRPVLFLVDEIFSGTNSVDRRAAAEAVVRALIGRGAIGALSTHDLTLCEIAGAGGLCGVNVHMGSREGGGPMEFDYRLKPGVTRERNALDIARMAGVPV